LPFYITSISTCFDSLTDIQRLRVIRGHFVHRKLVDYLKPAKQYNRAFFKYTMYSSIFILRRAFHNWAIFHFAGLARKLCSTVIVESDFKEF
jgi:hypothetical protein